jgi:hypothetical protein
MIAGALEEDAYPGVTARIFILGRSAVLSCDHRGEGVPREHIC